MREHPFRSLRGEILNYISEGEVNHRRKFGVHLTSVNIFNEYIRPKLNGIWYNHIWVDLFCGEGNLILPILNDISIDKRVEFFQKRIFLYDIQDQMVERTIENAKTYGISRRIAERNIQVKDTLIEFPDNLQQKRDELFHITNPPYLYLGYIAKHKENSSQLRYFAGPNTGLQDLYQVALMSDLKNAINQMVYIIPSNFLYGHSVSNLIRKSFLKHYTIKEAVIFEKKIFENTGTNVVVCFFKRTNIPNKTIEFDALKINSERKIRKYKLTSNSGFIAGEEFEQYVKINKKNILKVSYYLTLKEIETNRGDNRVVLLDSKEYSGTNYTSKEFFVNDKLYSKIKSNPLYIRTVDTGGEKGKAGLYSIKETFGTDGIYVHGKTYRTNPIQIFIEPTLNSDESKELQTLFNRVLSDLREKTDSEFMTTYKYSESGTYTRKYLGLSQAKKILETLQPSGIKMKQQISQIEDWS